MTRAAVNKTLAFHRPSADQGLWNDHRRWKNQQNKRCKSTPWFLPLPETKMRQNIGRREWVRIIPILPWKTSDLKKRCIFITAIMKKLMSFFMEIEKWGYDKYWWKTTLIMVPVIVQPPAARKSSNAFFEISRCCVSTSGQESKWLLRCIHDNTQPLNSFW